jgi:hypothetical protein
MEFKEIEKLLNNKTISERQSFMCKLRLKYESSLNIPLNARFYSHGCVIKNKSYEY